MKLISSSLMSLLNLGLTVADYRPREYRYFFEDARIAIEDVVENLCDYQSTGKI